MAEIKISELREDLKGCVRRVREGGEVLTVTRHGRPLVRIVPLDRDGTVVARVEGPEDRTPRLEGS